MFPLFEKFLEKINFFFDKDTKSKYEFIKLVFLGCAFFFIIATYSIIRPLKTSVFLGLVGKEYQPITKLLSIIVLIPCLLLYAKLVDKLKRHQVVYFFLILYIIGNLIASIILLHPTIGLPNTQTNPNRIFGWIFYLFTELYSPLAINTFWAFANSVNSIEYAKKNYGYIIAFSRVGGITSSITSWFIIDKTTLHYSQIIPILLIVCSVFLALSYYFVAKVIKKVPENLLHGYEAAYIAEQKRKEKTGIFEGIKIAVKTPYVFGIFGMVYIYEIISALLDYQMQVLMSVESNNAIGSMSSFMFLYTASFQGLSLFFALVGTSTLLKKIGVNLCILIMPIAIALLMFGLIYNPNLTTIFTIMVFLRALHYGFNLPVREILYIPTTKDVKFKAKSWIESFGRSLSKTSGATFNFLSRTCVTSTLIRIDSLITITFSFIWFLIAVYLGKTYTKTVEENKVIGEE